MARRGADEGEAFDRELAHLPSEARWREWTARIEAVLFASAEPVPREALARAVGEGAALDLLIEDVRAAIADRPFELARVGEGWMLRTRRRHAGAIRAAAGPLRAGGSDGDPPALREADQAALAAIALHQPATRADLAALFGREVAPDTFARLRARGLIASGPRSPRPGSPQSFVTTPAFLTLFGLRDLEELREAAEEGEACDGAP